MLLWENRNWFWRVRSWFSGTKSFVTVSKACILIPTIIVILICNCSYVQSQIHPYQPSAELDSLYESLNQYKSMFCHDAKHRLVSYEDSSIFILFKEGSPDSLVSKNRDWYFNFQEKEIVLLDEFGKEYTLARKGQDVLVQYSDTSISLLEGSKSVVSYGMKPDFKNQYNIYSTRINNFRIYITCDTLYTRIFKVDIHFSHKASLFMTLSAYDINVRPYESIYYSSHNKRVLDILFDLYGHLDFMLVHLLTKEEGFYFSSLKKKVNPRITWLYFFSEMTEFPDGELHWPYYPMYTYRKSGRLKKQLIEISNCY